MPTVNGMHLSKISTVYDTQKGIEAIKETILKSKKLRITTIPPFLLRELMPLLADKDTKILLLPGEKMPEKSSAVTDIAVSKTRLLGEFKGEEVTVGTITTPAVSFNVMWKDDKILDISAMNYERCVRCLGETFEDSSWRFADKFAEHLPQADDKKAAEPKNHII